MRYVLASRYRSPNAARKKKQRRAIRASSQRARKKRNPKSLRRNPSLRSAVAFLLLQGMSEFDVSKQIGISHGAVYWVNHKRTITGNLPRSKEELLKVACSAGSESDDRLGHSTEFADLPAAPPKNCPAGLWTSAGTLSISGSSDSISTGDAIALQFASYPVAQLGMGGSNSDADNTTFKDKPTCEERVNPSDNPVSGEPTKDDGKSRENDSNQVLSEDSGSSNGITNQPMLALPAAETQGNNVCCTDNESISAGSGSAPSISSVCNPAPQLATTTGRAVLPQQPAGEPTINARCPHCGDDRVWKRGTRSSHNSIASSYECRNPACSMNGKSFTINNRLAVPGLSKVLDYDRASNKIPGQLTEQLFEDFYFQGKRRQELKEELAKRYSISVSNNTITNVAAKVGSEYGKLLFGENLLRSKGVGKLLGFKYGNKKYHYLLVDVTPYPSHGSSLYLYVAMNYPKPLVLDFRIADEMDSRITEELLASLRNCDYRPSVVISDRGTDVVGPIKRVFPDARHEYCARHLLVDARKLLIEKRVKDKQLNDLRQYYEKWVESIIKCPYQERFQSEVDRLEQDKRNWSKDADLERTIGGFVADRDHYAVHYEYPGCPSTTNALEGYFAKLDVTRRKFDLGRNPEKWKKHLVSLLSLRNRRLLDKLDSGTQPS